MVNPFQTRAIVSEIEEAEAESSSSELQIEILEQPGPVEGAIKFGTGKVNLSPAPIRAEWILEGTPVASNKLLSSSADGKASTFIWACTAGRFNWHYDSDETVYVLEGSVIIKDPAGTRRRLVAGDTVYFPAGSRAEWTIESHLRKVAFCRAPVRSRVRRIYHVLRGMVGLRVS